MSLLKGWQLREEQLSCGKEMAAVIANKCDGWMNVASLPCDVHMALMDAGRIPEPLDGGNSLELGWIERRSWWFRKSFTLTAEQLQNFGAELFIEILDIHADVFVNGAWIAHHASAFFPLRKDVSPWLKEGENTLLIRLSTGIEYVDDRQIEPVRDFVSCDGRTRQKGRGDDRRVALRKPQYVYGWDQSPRLPTCAIAGDVRLEFLDEVVVRDIRVETLSLSQEGAHLLVQAQIDSRERLFARECVACFTLERDGRVVYEKQTDFMAQIGLNYVDFSLVLPDPELWWPNGYGEQPLYTARVKVSNQYGAQDEASVLTGIRTLELDTSAINAEERNYAFKINGVKIYCKGMDLIHVDCIYARGTDELYDKLLLEAKDANFNMLRFWAEGIYESDHVYEMCDRLGLLVYQSMIFPCAAFPDHVPEFNALVEQETRYQMRRLRSHPCIAIWVGCGENLGLLHSYFGQNYKERENMAIHPGGTYLVGELMPRIHHEMIATVPYQCCSPFGGFTVQQTAKRGDCHRYPFLNLDPAYQQTRISVESFDDISTKFMTEGGVMGPPSVNTLIRYCGGRENITEDNPIFTHHRNSFERFAVRDGIYKHYTGEKELSVEEYCLYGGLFQGEMLAYYADHLRLVNDCTGCVLWCFTDGYGEVGFSVMDRFANRKPAYYYMRRAYDPHRLVIKRKDDKMCIYCANDTPQAKQLTLQYGYVSFDGKYGPVSTVSVQAAPYAKRILAADVPVEEWDLQKGVFYVRGEGLTSAIYRAGDFRTLTLSGPAKLTVSDFVRDGEALTFTVQTDCFAHAVHFGLAEDKCLSDEYFNLLPGESRTVTVYNAADLDETQIAPRSVYLP